MTKIILILSLVLLSLNAKDKTIIQSATYTMGDSESKTTARKKALFLAKRDAIEKAGIFVSSYSQVQKNKLDESIKSFSGSVMKIEILKESFKYPKYFIKIKAKINTEKLNQKIKNLEFNKDTKEDTKAQILSTNSEIEEYNNQIQEILKEKEKKQELKALQEKKQILIKRLNNISKNKAIDIDIVKDKNYGYINIKSNRRNTEIYLDDKYIGIAPIKKYKIPSDTDIEIKAMGDKRYIPDESKKTINIKKLTYTNVDINLKSGIVELFFVGDDGDLFLNGKFIRTLNDENRLIKTYSSKDKVKIEIINKNKYFKKTKDLYANNTYEIKYDLKKTKNTKRIAKLKKAIVKNITKIDDEIWQSKKFKTISKSQEEAIKYCDDLVFGGFDDWQLPSSYKLKKRKLKNYWGRGGKKAKYTLCIRNTSLLDFDFGYKENLETSTKDLKYSVFVGTMFKASKQVSVGVEAYNDTYYYSAQYYKSKIMALDLGFNFNFIRFGAGSFISTNILAPYLFAQLSYTSKHSIDYAMKVRIAKGKSGFIATSDISMGLRF